MTMNKSQNMPDVVIKFGTPEYDMVGDVFLDGFVQPRVEVINFTQGYIRRPYTGPCLNRDQVKLSNGYVFDLEKDDFILELVHGDVQVRWKDRAVARAWMQRHAQ